MGALWPPKWAGEHPWGAQELGVGIGCMGNWVGELLSSDWLIFLFAWLPICLFAWLKICLQPIRILPFWVGELDISLNFVTYYVMSFSLVTILHRYHFFLLFKGFYSRDFIRGILVTPYGFSPPGSPITPMRRGAGGGYLIFLKYFWTFTTFSLY